MMQSNQPYGRVDDGIGAGLVSGAVIGGAMAGATHRWGGRAIEGMKESARNSMRNSQNNMDSTMRREGVSSSDSIGAQRQHSKNVNKKQKVMKGLKGAEDLRGKGFGGGWKGKAVAYGGSVLAGSLLGAAGDAMND